jgi:hypothetical protein
MVLWGYTLGYHQTFLTFVQSPSVEQKVKLRHIKKKLISESPERYRVKVKIKKKSPPSDVIFTKVKVRLCGIIR